METHIEVTMYGGSYIGYNVWRIKKYIVYNVWRLI